MIEHRPKPGKDPETGEQLLVPCRPGEYACPFCRVRLGLYASCSDWPEHWCSAQADALLPLVRMSAEPAHRTGAKVLAELAELLRVEQAEKAAAALVRKAARDAARAAKPSRTPAPSRGRRRR